jgi:hypothetical protein
MPRASKSSICDRNSASENPQLRQQCIPQALRECTWFLGLCSKLDETSRSGNAQEPSNEPRTGCLQGRPVLTVDRSHSVMPKSAVGMKARSPAPPRKKACKQCTAAKARCSLDKPTCQRCQSRDLPCEFLALPNLEVLARAPSSGADVTPAGQSVGPGDHLLASTAPVDDVFLNQQTGHTYRQEAQNPNAEFRGQRHTRTERQIDFGNIDLIPMTDSASIRNRWLQSFLPSTGKRAKILPPHTVQYLSCVFKSYSRRLLRPGCLPPFIHPLQMVDGELPLSLANCFSLVQM